MTNIVRQALNQGIRAHHSIMITGGSSGRLGPQIKSQLEKNSYSVICTSSRSSTSGAVHLSMSDAASKLEAIIKQFQPHLLIHSAALSSGSYKDMYQINVEGTNNIASACKTLGIPLIYLSSKATLASELSEDQPYAYTKMLAEEAVRENGGYIARLDALVGDKDSTTIALAHMAGNKMAPISVRTNQNSEIQPITYDDAARGISKMAEAILNGDDVVKEVDIVGDPVLLYTFLDMVMQDTLHLYVSPEDLRPLARLVNNGAFSPEFLDLAERDVPVVSNADLKKLLGNEQMATPEEVAKVARETASMTQLLKIARSVISNKSFDEKKAIIKEVIILIKKAKLGGSMSLSNLNALRKTTSEIKKEAK